MNIGQALAYIFFSPHWKARTAVFCGLLLVPVIGWLLVAGYLLALIRNVAVGQRHPLPEWRQWTRHFVAGSKAALVLITWSMPLLILFMVLQSVSSDLLAIRAVQVGLLYLVFPLIAITDLAVDGNMISAISFEPVRRVIRLRLVYWVFLKYLAVAFMPYFFISLFIAGTLGERSIFILVPVALTGYLLTCAHLAGQAYCLARGQQWTSK